MRNPTKLEIRQRSRLLRSNPRLEEHIEDMIKSEEFSLTVLPYLISRSQKRTYDQNIFFLHVPKTAGTSVRIALAKEIGMGSFNLYYNSSSLQKVETEKMHFWPYWSGHANISVFPKSHIGFTTFRETRSRLLSTYRQTQFNAQLGENLHDKNGEITSAIKTFHSGKFETFDIWLQNFGSSICHFFVYNENYQNVEQVDNPYEKFLQITGTTYEWRRLIDSLSEKYLRQELDSIMKRFQAVAWVHDPVGLKNGISRITLSKEREIILGRVNEFRLLPNMREEKISKKSIELMSEICRKDEILFESARKAGILTSAKWFDIDKIFHKTMKDLHFRLD